ncbi:MAG: lipase family protein [Lactovum sp.]
MSLYKFNDLTNYANIYANMSQSAYRGRPISFPDHQEKAVCKVELIDYSQKYGAEKLVNGGKLYLQADLNQTLTDEKTGFNAYFLTETLELNRETEKCYLAIRGSDPIKFDHMNDWLMNNANFALKVAYIPQAKIAKHVLQENIKEIKEKTKEAYLDITGHSLGSIVAVQALAELTEEELKVIRRLVLFNGPDCWESLEKMSCSKEQIERISEKIIYYINPFDIISMVNREKPFQEQLGRVKYIVPFTLETTLIDTRSHDFGELQINEKGEILVVEDNFYLDLIEKGQETAELAMSMLTQIKTLTKKNKLFSQLVSSLGKE